MRCRALFFCLLQGFAVKKCFVALTLPALLLWSMAAQAQAHSAAEIKADVQRHRAMAVAHEAAAACLESGKGEGECLKVLQAACKGLAIGKYCGMKHAH